MLEIVVDAPTRESLEQDGITQLTIDIESYSSSCLTVSEAVVLKERPKDARKYDRYDLDGLEIFVYSPMEFINNRVIITKAKGLFSKDQYKAEHLKQI